MNVWVFVEGPGDRIALEALWKNWRASLRNAGHGIHVIPLANKSQLFRKLGHRAAEKLCGDPQDVAIGLPDLYPNAPYKGTEYEHQDVRELKDVQRRLVRSALVNVYGVNQSDTDAFLSRFLPSAFRHDLEVLLLAAKEELRNHLRTRDRLQGLWCNPVEDQNQDRPPKRVVEGLFKTRSAKRRAYRDTKDAGAVLRNVTNIRSLIYTRQGHLQCPVFKTALDWIGTKTGIAAYT